MGSKPDNRKTGNRRSGSGSATTRAAGASATRANTRAAGASNNRTNVRSNTRANTHATTLNTAKFLPTNASEMRERGWNHVDFVYISGDAYVDHPSFGTAIISRILEANGYKVGIIAQPDWRTPQSVSVFGKPKLGFLVSAGNMDSMVNHYTVNKKPRHDDAYSPGNKAGLRPNHACVVYGNLIRQTYKDSPIILGSIEASLRRLAHYDYWSDKIKRSILLDSGADIISYGMGETSIVEIADALAGGLAVSDITYIQGTAYKCTSLDKVYDYQELPNFSEISTNKQAYAESFAIQYRNANAFSGKRLVEAYSNHLYVVQNPPAYPLDSKNFDAVYELPYKKTYHPMYIKAGGVPAIQEVKFSITSNRGCFGECAFCALAFHQGRVISSRSVNSVVAEAAEMCNDPDFKGNINDIGGPTANFNTMACAKQKTHGACKAKRCVSPEVCKSLKVDHSHYLQMLRRVRELPGVKRVFVRSGIRYDYALLDSDSTFINELARYHTSGQLRVAPEHVSAKVLNLMGKPEIDLYKQFVEKFERASKRAGKEQYVLPYLMSSHPGSTLREAIELGQFCAELGYNPKQVQDFYPTPSTMSTVMYYTGIDPRTMQPVYVAKSAKEKAMQRALIQFKDPANYDLVRRALELAGRQDLIGNARGCLISGARPRIRDAEGGAGRKAGEARRVEARRSRSKRASSSRRKAGTSSNKNPKQDSHKNAPMGISTSSNKKRGREVSNAR